MFTSKSGPRDEAMVDLRRPASFEAFYREHLPFVRSSLARRVHDPFQVADLTAEVFLQVVQSADNYRPGLGPPRAWLTGIARHCWLTTDNPLPATARQPNGCRGAGY